MKKLLAILLMAPAIAFADSNTDYIHREKRFPCSDWKSVQKITKDFEEVRIGTGLSQNGDLDFRKIIVYVNSKTGTFTIVEKTEDGLWCLLAHGEDYRTFPVGKSKAK